MSHEAPQYRPPQQHQTRYNQEVERLLHGQAPSTIQRLLGQGDTSPWGSTKFWRMEGASQDIKQVTESRPLRGEITTESIVKRLLG